MNLGITLARKGKVWVVLTLPHEATVRDQTRQFRVLMTDKAIATKFDEIQIWESSNGMLKKRVLNATDGSRVRTVEQLLALDAEAKRLREAQKAPAQTAEPVKAPVKPSKSVKTSKSAEDLLE